MIIAEIKSKTYDHARDKWCLCALVKSGYMYGKYNFMYFLYDTEEEMNKVKVGDLVE